jgi:hypothetical protein
LQRLTDAFSLIAGNAANSNAAMTAVMERDQMGKISGRGVCQDFSAWRWQTAHQQPASRVTVLLLWESMPH